MTKDRFSAFTVIPEQQQPTSGTGARFQASLLSLKLERQRFIVHLSAADETRLVNKSLSMEGSRTPVPRAEKSGEEEEEKNG